MYKEMDSNTLFHRKIIFPYVHTEYFFRLLLRLHSYLALRADNYECIFLLLLLFLLVTKKKTRIFLTIKSELFSYKEVFINSYSKNYS